MKQSFIFNSVQISRLETRKKSLEIWRNTKSLSDFNQKMKPFLGKLIFLTKWNHRFLRIQFFLKNVIAKK